MPICNGRYVSDKFRGKLEKDGSEQYYHIAIECTNNTYKENDLCLKCIQKYERTTRVLINSKVPNKFHTSVLHGKKSDPIPSWSRCENGEWFKNMLSKKYMTRNKDIDVKAVYEFIDTLTGKVAEKVEKLVQKFPILSKTAAIKCLQDHKKSKTSEPKKEINKVDIVLKPTVVVKDNQEEQYDVVEINLEQKTIQNTKYLYEPNKNKVYTSDFKYVGRYDNKSEMICTEYPDSDAEPSFTL